MDFRVVTATFVSVFLAELGDKTQLATLAFASESRAKLSVFIGSGAALVASSALAVLAGDAVGRLVPAAWLKRAAGVAFVVIGAWVLWSSRRAG